VNHCSVALRPSRIPLWCDPLSDRHCCYCCGLNFLAIRGYTTFTALLHDKCLRPTEVFTQPRSFPDASRDDHEPAAPSDAPLPAAAGCEDPSDLPCLDQESGEIAVETQAPRVADLRLVLARFAGCFANTLTSRRFVYRRQDGGKSLLNLATHLSLQMTDSCTGTLLRAPRVRADQKKQFPIVS
jgi:hypothetical protein